MPTYSKEVRLAQRPEGYPDSSTWDVAEVEVPEPGPGEFVVRVELISLDPAMRGWLNDVRSYVPPVGIGEVMRALAAGTVTASKHDGYAVGDVVSGTFGVTTAARERPLFTAFSAENTAVFTRSTPFQSPETFVGRFAEYVTTTLVPSSRPTPPKIGCVKSSWIVLPDDVFTAGAPETEMLPRSSTSGAGTTSVRAASRQPVGSRLLQTSSTR